MDEEEINAPESALCHTPWAEQVPEVGDFLHITTLCDLSVDVHGLIGSLAHALMGSWAHGLMRVGSDLCAYLHSLQHQEGVALLPGAQV